MTNYDYWGFCGSPAWTAVNWLAKQQMAQQARMHPQVRLLKLWIHNTTVVLKEIVFDDSNSLWHASSTYATWHCTHAMQITIAALTLYRAARKKLHISLRSTQRILPATQQLTQRYVLIAAQTKTVAWNAWYRDCAHEQQQVTDVQWRTVSSDVPISQILNASRSSALHYSYQNCCLLTGPPAGIANNLIKGGNMWKYLVPPQLCHMQHCY